jgi:hypothetical protein
VKGVKKPGWCAVLRLKHRNPFSMPEATNKGNEGEIDVDSHTCNTPLSNSCSSCCNHEFEVNSNEFHPNFYPIQVFI